MNTTTSSTNGITHSLHHLAVVGDFEFFTNAAGDLYRARINLPIGPDGYRQGARWEAPAHMAVEMLNQYRTLHNAFKNK